MVVALGSLLSAFWVLPFVWDRHLLTDMRYSRRPAGPGDSYWQMLFPHAVTVDRLLFIAAISGIVG
jgi:hypothetical protein